MDNSILLIEKIDIIKGEGAGGVNRVWERGEGFLFKSVTIALPGGKDKFIIKGITHWNDLLVCWATSKGRSAHLS